MLPMEPFQRLRGMSDVIYLSDKTWEKSILGEMKYDESSGHIWLEGLFLRVG